MPYKQALQKTALDHSHTRAGNFLHYRRQPQKPEGSGEALRDQPKDRGEVEEADLGGRSADRPEGAAFDRPHGRGGGGNRRFPALYAAAAR